MDQIFSQEVRPLLDLIDKLRQIGVQNEISLPQICVMGDQSSGKSSVLQSISGNNAILYLINADTGALIKAIDTGSGSISSPNGLSTPSLYDNNGDGNVDYVYAGDLDGHLWKFNLSGAVPSLYAVQDNTGGTNALLTTSPLQAVTAAPAVIKHPTGIGQMVVFATGRFLTSADLTSATQQSVYGMWMGLQPI